MFYDKIKFLIIYKLVFKGIGLVFDCFVVVYWNFDLKEGWFDFIKFFNLFVDK